jgi:superfamily II DNA or RNA helicase
MTRDERQTEIITKFKSSGTLIAATGFGKTYIGIRIIKMALYKDPSNTIIVVTPTINLCNQWKEQIEKHKITNCEVFVINTACTLNKECTLLVLDEIHEYGGDVFSKVFTNIKSKAILGLTATLEENTPIAKLVDKYCPVFDTVTLEECRSNNWVANYKVYNLPVELTPAETKLYNKYDYLYRKSEDALGGRFKAFDNANYYIKIKHPIHKDTAFLYLMMVKKRRSLLINAENKIKAIKEIKNKFRKRKTLIFSESIDFAEKVNEVLKNSKIYHSKISKKDKELALNEFAKGDINTLISVKALNAGVDIPDCSLGIVASGNSKVIDDVQRVGRVIRSDDSKQLAIFINIYVPNTQDEKWMRKRQINQIPIPINHIKEIDMR